jgi:hypothetical protein
MSGGRRFGRMIVAHQRQHAAVFGGTRQVGVAKHVAGAVNAGPLAVPHAKDAIELAFTAEFSLLGAPHRSSSKIFVDPTLKTNVAFFQKGAGAIELGVKRPKRRAAITGDKARRVEAVAAVQLFLH